MEIADWGGSDCSFLANVPTYLSVILLCSDSTCDLVCYDAPLLPNPELLIVYLPVALPLHPQLAL